MDNINIRIYNRKNPADKTSAPILNILNTPTKGLIQIKSSDNIQVELGSGIVDGNGNEIFTGHLVKMSLQNEFGSFEERLGLMEFHQGSFHITTAGSNSYGYISTPIPPVIIGHRMENPDLLAKWVEETKTNEPANSL